MHLISTLCAWLNNKLKSIRPNVGAEAAAEAVVALAPAAEAPPAAAPVAVLAPANALKNFYDRLVDDRKVVTPVLIDALRANLKNARFWKPLEVNPPAPDNVAAQADPAPAAAI